MSVTQGTKYVKAITTGDNGEVTATIQGISTSVNDSIITLVPLANASTAATMTTGSSQSLYGWRCGNSATDGTNVNPKYLPGSCRG